MTSLDTQFAGSIPEIYDSVLVPMIFEVYANDLAERVRSAGALKILETAAGTGALTRALAAKLPPEARIVATDLNQPMLDFNARRGPSEPRVVRRQADALALPFDAESFDAVACQFGAMVFPDKIHGYREARRVLMPGGTFAFNVWGPLSENVFTQVASDALADYFPEDPPKFMERTPHGYHDAEEICRQLELAGFSSVSAETREHLSRGRSPQEVAFALCQGTPWRNEIEARASSALEAVTAHVERALARRFGDGPFEGKIQALVVTAVA